ncbi:MAG: MlaD family protein, partial [Actinomycetota bacterium]
MPRFLPGLRKSFLERNQLIIGAIGVTVVLLGSVLAVLLSGGVFANTYQVTAVFKDAAGIRSGDDVTVAGLDAGSIGAVRIVDGLVEIELKINSDVEMPADSDASIVVETLLGRKSVQLLGGNSDDMLAEGDLIPLERTTTPIEIDDLNDASVSLLERSDAEALQQLMIEVTKVTKGKEQEIGTVIDGLADVTAALDSKKEELQRLIESMSTLSTTFASRDDE